MLLLCNKLNHTLLNTFMKINSMDKIFNFPIRCWDKFLFTCWMCNAEHSRCIQIVKECHFQLCATVSLYCEISHKNANKWGLWQYAKFHFYKKIWHINFHQEKIHRKKQIFNRHLQLENRPLISLGKPCIIFSKLLYVYFCVPFN